MNRRNILYGGAAAVAAATGAGVAWWKIQPHQTSAVAPSTTALADPFWAMGFDTPDGQTLAMNSFLGKPLLVNFWGTWCPPCVEELPLLNSFYGAHKSRGWQLLGLAVDQPSAVRKWLQAKPLDFPVGMAGLGGTELSKAMGNTAGSLPFTVVFDAAGQVQHRKIGKVTPEELKTWAAT